MDIKKCDDDIETCGPAISAPYLLGSPKSIAPSGSPLQTHVRSHDARGTDTYTPGQSHGSHRSHRLKESSMLAAPQTFTWPVRPHAVAYIQVDDFVELLFHDKASAFAACEFCRTVNYKGAARCRVCRGNLPARGEDDRREPGEQGPRNTATLSDLRLLANALLPVLLPPLLLFGAFGAWYQLRSQSPASAAVSAISLSSPAKNVEGSPVPTSAKRRSIGGDVLKSIEISDPGTAGGEALSRLPGASRPANGHVGAVGRSPSASSSPPRSAPIPSRGKLSAPVHHEQDLLAVCDGGNFLVRAICVNTRCAEPKAARLEQCREAVRQRRIDEARRNPTLVG
jgi:hypothetical protein